MKHSCSWTLAVCASFTAIGCPSNDDVKPTPYIGTIELAVTLPSGRTFHSVDYSLTRVGGYSKSGSLAVTVGVSTVHQTIDGVPIGENYQLEVDAEESESHVRCTRARHLDVASHQTTVVGIYLQCSEQADSGQPDKPSDAGVDARDANTCPVVASATATGADDGLTFMLHASAGDTDRRPAALSYRWSASGGTLSDSMSADAMLTCSRPGVSLMVDLTVSDSVCSDHATLSVVCGAAGSGCQEDATGIDLAAPAASSTAVAYQIDAQHSGSQPNDTLTLPLAARWTHDFAAGGVSYPLVAAGRVFVTVGHSASYGAALYALDAASGVVLWGPVELGGTYYWANATYAAGRVFAVNGDGLMAAYAADSGQQLWTKKLPGQYAFSSAPTAFGGRVYVGGAGSGGTLYAVDAGDGSVLWTAPVENGDHSSPAVDANGVFVSYACNQAYGFSRTCGAALWHYAGECEGGGGKTIALLNGKVYTRDFEGDLVLDAESGALVGSYGSDVIPAGANGMLYTIIDGKITAREAGVATPKWSFGDGTLASAPLVVGSHVVVGSKSGALSVLAATDGSVASSYMLGAPVAAPDEQNVSAPLSGMAAADNHLYVPAGKSLTAF